MYNYKRVLLLYYRIAMNRGIERSWLQINHMVTRVAAVQLEVDAAVREAKAKLESKPQTGGDVEFAERQRSGEIDPGAGGGSDVAGSENADRGSAAVGASEEPSANAREGKYAALVRAIPKDFGFDRFEIVHETISGMNHWNFPSDMRWRDADVPSLFWRRVGLYVFDFKGKRLRHADIPRGVRTIVRTANGVTVLMKVFVERAFLQNRALVEENVAVGRDRPITSANCGRAVLRFLNISVTLSTLPKSKWTPKYPPLPANVKSASERMSVVGGV